MAGLAPIDPFFQSNKIYSLTDFTFKPFLSNVETVLVMFYNPNDTNNCILSKDFAEAACITRRKNHAYAAVDCSNFGYFCSTQDANDTPMFRLYSNGYKVRTVRDTRYFNSPTMIDSVQSAPVLNEPLDEEDCGRG